MKIKNLSNLDIIKNENVSTRFLSVNLEKIVRNYKIYKGEFYLDSFNYFPITNDNFSFLEFAVCIPGSNIFNRFF